MAYWFVDPHVGLLDTKFSDVALIAALKAVETVAFGK